MGRQQRDNHKKIRRRLAYCRAVVRAVFLCGIPVNMLENGDEFRVRGTWRGGRFVPERIDPPARGRLPLTMTFGPAPAVFDEVAENEANVVNLPGYSGLEVHISFPAD